MGNGWRNQYYRYKELFLNISALYQKKPELKMFLELILTLSTVTLFGALALRPTVITITELYREIQEKEEVIAKMDTKIANLKTITNILQTNVEDIDLVNAAVPDEPALQTLVDQIQKIADKNGVTISGVSSFDLQILGASTKKKSANDIKPISDKTTDVPISISVKGDYTNLLNFINEVENLRRPIKVDVLNVTSVEVEKSRVVSIIVSGRNVFSKK